jgi:integrase-recombinase
LTNFPYQSAFNNWLKVERKLALNTTIRIDNAVSHFWNHYITNSNKEAILKNINQSTINDYLDFLEQHEQLKKSTINKYLSYIRTYFTFLYNHSLISHYPLLNIKGRHYSRQHTYKIDWMSHLSDIINLPNLQAETKLLLICISLGFKPDEILRLRFTTLISKTNSKVIKSYLKKCKNKRENKNPYVFETPDGRPYMSQQNIERHIMMDRDFLGMKLTLRSLRRSFIYSIIMKNYSDDDLLKRLKISKASLVNYRKNLIYFVKTEPFKLTTIETKKASI